MKNRKNAGRNRRVRNRKASSLGRHKKSVLMISAVLVMLCGVLTVNSITLMAKNDSYKEQEKELRSQIDEQKERAEEIDEFEEYVKTDEYVKETAEEKLNLVDPNEIIFKAAEYTDRGANKRIEQITYKRDSGRISPGVLFLQRRRA